MMHSELLLYLRCLFISSRSNQIVDVNCIQWACT